jgi:hypothetical protein
VGKQDNLALFDEIHTFYGLAFHLWRDGTAHLKPTSHRLQWWQVNVVCRGAPAPRKPRDMFPRGAGRGLRQCWKGAAQRWHYKTSPQGDTAALAAPGCVNLKNPPAKGRSILRTFRDLRSRPPLVLRTTFPPASGGTTDRKPSQISLALIYKKCYFYKRSCFHLQKCLFL